MMDGGVSETDRDDRLLRGGSFFDNRGRDLRSTNRNRNRPENRNENIGFRCVRAPRRQHAASKVPCRVRRGFTTPHPDNARSSRPRAERPGVFFFLPPFFTPLFQRGAGGDFRRWRPGLEENPPQPPFKKGGSRECRGEC